MEGSTGPSMALVIWSPQAETRYLLLLRPEEVGKYSTEHCTCRFRSIIGACDPIAAPCRAAATINAAFGSTGYGYGCSVARGLAWPSPSTSSSAVGRVRARAVAVVEPWRAPQGQGCRDGRVGAALKGLESEVRCGK